MSTCTALATKAELSAYATRAEVAELRQTVALLAGKLAFKADKSDLENKLDKSEKQPIVEASIAGALGQVNPVIAVLQALILAMQGTLKQLQPLIPIVATLLAIAPFLFDLYSRVNALVGQVAGHTRRLDGHDLQIRQLEIINEIQGEDIKRLNKIVAAQAKEIEKANAEIKRLEFELIKANLAIEKLNSEVTHANRIATEANQKAALATVQANKARAEAIGANAKADKAIAEANSASYEARLANLMATLASRRAQDAFDQSLMAIDRAYKAQQDANKAALQANMAWLAAQQANSTSQQTQQDLTNLGWRTESGEIAKSWNKTVWEPLVFQPMATQWTKQIERSYTTVTQSFDSKFEQTRQQIQTSIRTQYGNLTNVELGNFERQLEENKKAVAALQGALPKFGDIDNRVGNLERTTANTNTQIQTLSNTQADTQTRLREQEKVNAQANTQLAGIQTGIQNLTTTISNTLSPTLADVQTKVGDIPTTAAIGVATVGIMVQSPSIRKMLTDTSAEANCRTAQPGGCVGRQFGNLGNTLGNAINSTGAKIIDAGNSAYQTAMLRQIDAKLGAQLAGGIGGKLTKFFDWALGDRVMNLVIFTTTLHNAMMLSNSISTTLFSCMDNIANMGRLALNPDGEAIDSQQWISKQLDTFFEGVFGKTLWVSMKASYTKANNIFSTSSNVYNNLRSIHSDSQELLNMVRRDTAELGNALVEEGVISEDNWEVRDPKIKLKSKSLGRLQRMNEGLEALDNKLQAIEMVTATLLSIAESAKEIKDNVTTLNTELTSANTQFKTTRDLAIQALPDFGFDIDDLF